jgi:error-prone DNA polymerase
MLNSQLLGVHGIVEKRDNLVHLVAGRLFDYSQLLGSLELQSRDFH